jgi:predicted secreted protein
MSSSAISSMGAKFYRYVGTIWVAVAEITGIDGPSKSRETIDVTTLDSADGYREVIGDLRDGGTVSLSMNFKRAEYDLMATDFESDSVANYAIVLADTDRTAIEFEGLVTEMPLSAAVGDKLSADVTIKVTGKPTTADGSSGAFGNPWS